MCSSRNRRTASTARSFCQTSLVEVLRKHRNEQQKDREVFKDAYKDDDLVFAAPDGLPVLPWSFTASFRYLVDRAKVPYIRLHDLRDTHASLLGKHGVPLEVISKRLGHATIGITAEPICTFTKNETPRRRLCSISSPAKASR